MHGVRVTGKQPTAPSAVKHDYSEPVFGIGHSLHNATAEELRKRSEPGSGLRDRIKVENG